MKPTPLDAACQRLCIALAKLSAAADLHAGPVLCASLWCDVQEAYLAVGRLALPHTESVLPQAEPVTTSADIADTE